MLLWPIFGVPKVFQAFLLQVTLNNDKTLTIITHMQGQSGAVCGLTQKDKRKSMRRKIATIHFPILNVLHAQNAAKAHI